MSFGRGLVGLLASVLWLPVLAQSTDAGLASVDTAPIVVQASSPAANSAAAGGSAATADIVKRFQPPPISVLRTPPDTPTLALPPSKPVNPGHDVTPSVSSQTTGQPRKTGPAKEDPGLATETAVTEIPARTQISTPTTNDLRLLRVRALVKGGAMRLAVTTLDRFQQKTIPDNDWWLLEQERLQILNQLQDWQAIVERTTQPRAALPLKIKQSLSDWLAMARLKLHQGDQARQVLRNLLWSKRVPNTAYQNSWRRQLIRSYLVAGKYQDAKTAALRYREEFLPADTAWTYLFVRVLLAAKDPQLALRWLRADQTFEGRLLRLQAQLMAGGKPSVVQTGAQQLMTILPPDAKSLRRELWSLTAAAANRAGDYPAQLQALEQALNIPPQPSDYRLTEPDISSLIKVLLKTGEQLGNAANLILGEDGPWLELARSAVESHPLRAQSLFAVLVRQGEAEFTRRRAHEALIELLFKADRKFVALQLYADKDWLPSVDVLSDSSRYLLAETDMRQGKISQAADLVKDLVRPPSGVDPLDWILRRARLAVYAGDTTTANRLIGDYLQPLGQIGEGAAQRIQQVLFDLQSVGAHRLALSLFRSLRQRVSAPQLQREMLFWMADSRAAIKEYRRAAELYLGSALTGDNSFDLWGQSARYKAAEVLVKADLIEDARRLYKSLLRATADVKRRAQLQRRLQELWLRKTS